jgi:nitroreductase
MKFKDLLAKTQFIKKYTNRKPKIDVITEAIIIANEGPKAGNIQPFQFVIVEDPEGIATIAEACQQSFIAKAPYVIIVTSDVTQTKRLYGDKADKYIKQNVGAAVQNLTLQLADSGISSSLVGPFSEETLRNNFGIPEGKEIEMIITLGEGMGEAKTMRSPALINKIFFGSFGNKFHEPTTKVTRKDM